MLRPNQDLATALFWSAPPPGKSDFSAEDPLALDYLGRQVGLWLLPSLTTRTSRAQYYAVVLYGLHLAERAIRQFDLPFDDDTRARLFERWERFWALAVMESRDGTLAKSDPDSMRGVRGAKRAWSPGTKPLSLEFELISRQLELGGLGAYLSSLRSHGLVTPGTLRVSPAGQPIVDAFWSEPANRKNGVYETYALLSLEPGRAPIPRKHRGVTLRRVGALSRLSRITAAERGPQRRRVWEALFEGSRDDFALAIAQVVGEAFADGIRDPETLVEMALAGRWSALKPRLQAELLLALRYGRAARALLDLFNAVYGALVEDGWITSQDRVASDVMGPRLEETRPVWSALLKTRGVGKLRSLRFHGGPFLRLVEVLSHAQGEVALAELLRFHRAVQRSRQRGFGWIREEQDKLILDLTTYNGHQRPAEFPQLKLDVVRSLLADLGRLR